MNAFSIRLLAGMSLFILPWSVCAQWVQQTIPLKPGWNAVFIEVQPSPEDCDPLFAGLPVESVWEWNRSGNSPQFVQDPSTLIPGSPGWLSWFGPNHPLASQSSLFILRDGRPYLIKVADTAQPLNWVITGKPSLRRLEWQVGGVNFAGFRVGAQGPTFQNLFAGEAGLSGQPVYSLDSDGVWRSVANLSSTRVTSGQGYWIRCSLPAQRVSTIQIEGGSRSGLVFFPGAAEQSLRIRNTSAGARNISVRVLPSSAPPPGQPPLAGPVPLEYWRTDYAQTNIGWETLASPVNFTGLPAGQEWNLRLGVRWAAAVGAVSGSQYQSLLEVADDLGSRWLIPLNADPAPPSTAGDGLSQLSAASSVPHTGLWIGEVVLNRVSQPAHPSDPSLPRPGGGELVFRLILHVDGGGTTRLLQSVYVVRKPPVSAPDPDNPDLNRVVEPARTVAVTDEAMIPGIVGSGEIIGRRISSAAFAFKQPIVLAGGSFGSGTLTTGITLDYDDPLNPFKHVYHPDHNNLDERFEQKLPEGRESFTVTRSLSFEFTFVDPLGLNPPGWGESELGGNYREVIQGLHRNVIHVGGTFRLVRTARAAFLNQ